MQGLVTINTDASFMFQEKRGSYAFWIKSDYGKLCHSGVLKGKIDNSTIAECMCILNALVALKKQQWGSIQKIIVNTDSLNAKHIFNRDMQEINRYNLKYGNFLYKHFLKIKDSLPQIEFRHVKAHTDTKDARSYVNNWCDEEAKRQLKQYLSLNKND